MDSDERRRLERLEIMQWLGILGLSLAFLGLWYGLVVY